MSNPVHNVNKINAGTCPHGCAPSACPICSNMGGGGFRPRERAQKPGEMSYHECAMLGALMRAREARINEHEKNLLNHAEMVKAFESGLESAAHRLMEIASKLSQNILFRPAAFLITRFFVPVLNFIKNLPQVIVNFHNKFQLIKIDIQDKLNAIFGEAKSFFEKKVSEFVSQIKSKFEGLFKIFKRNNAKDDETKIDEDKKIFRLKTFIKELLRRNNDSEDKSES